MLRVSFFVFPRLVFKSISSVKYFRTSKFNYFTASNSISDQNRFNNVSHRYQRVKYPFLTMAEIIHEGSPSELKEFIETNSINVNMRNNYLRTPLMIATEKNKLEMMQLLIDYGALLNAEDLFGEFSII
jgi:ankyrin repeat protein